jgi:hypothetical protein
MSRPPFFPLAVLVIVLAACLAAGAWLAIPLGEALGSSDIVTFVVVVVVPPLVMLIGALVAALDLGESRPASGELERLLQQKQDGSLTERARRVPDRGARVRHRSASLPPASNEVGLERLLRLKREGGLAGPEYPG